ncbi:hypothetical protein SUGI_0374240 [Cryptomeria japonica]|nr:hypothetical protein SUGI_0374240 [Cryptomeria japonica]
MFRQFREAAKDITQQIGETTHDIAAKVDEYGRGMIRTNRSTLFEELGLLLHRPLFIQAVTEKEKNYSPAEKEADRLHGVVKFDPDTGNQVKPNHPTLSYTQSFAEGLNAEA